MAEAPRPLPLEEQIKQDLRFDYLLDISPEFINTLLPLFSAQQKDPKDLHSSFWITFSKKYNLLARGIRDELQGEEVFQGEMEEHREAFKDWLNEDIADAINVSAKAGFFDEASPFNRLGFFDQTSPSNLLAGLNEMPDDLVMEYEPQLTEIPGRVLECAQEITNRIG